LLPSQNLSAGKALCYQLEFGIVLAVISGLTCFLLIERHSVKPAGIHSWWRVNTEDFTAYACSGLMCSSGYFAFLYLWMMSLNLTTCHV